MNLLDSRLFGCWATGIAHWEAIVWRSLTQIIAVSNQFQIPNYQCPIAKVSVIELGMLNAYHFQFSKPFLIQ